MLHGKTYRIYMVGPSFKTQGGISSVLYIYYIKYKNQLNLGFIPSYSGNSRVWDLIYFFHALMRTLLICILNGGSCFHIHTSTNGSYFRKSIIARICLLLGRKVILHMHGADFDSFIENSNPGKKQKIIRLLNNAHRIVVLSYSWHEYFSKYVPPRKIKVVYNPCMTIDTEYRKRDNSRTNLLFMGRLEKRKGVYDLIRAVKYIRPGNFILKLYGDGDVEKVRGIVNKEKLDGVISVNGWISHLCVSGIYDEADLLVLPSYAEGLPMAVLEAIGKGLPVIATGVGGTAEAVIDGENGFLVKPGDMKALVEKLEILINNAALREKMGRKSLEIARNKFGTGVVERQLRELYSELDDR